MPRIYLSLGSNIDRRRHISLALDALGKQFGQLVYSPVFESVAVGFEGDNFYNMVVGIDAELSVEELSMRLKKIEDDHGRVRSGPRFSSRTMDIDILTCGGATGVVDGVSLPREEILHNAFVLWPLAEIAPYEIHPVAQRTYAQLWAAFDKSSQELWPVAFD